MTPFPPGWSSGSIDTVTSKPLKVDPASTGREHVRYVDIGLLEGPRSHLDAAPEVLSAAAPSRCRQVIAAGDTLYSTVRPYLRKVALVADDLDGEFASTGYAVLRPTEAIDPAFLFYFTLSKHFEDQILPMQKGVSYPAVLDREVRAQRVWFPELEQQRRIVEILEDHLSHLDAAAADLTRANVRLESLSEAALQVLIPGDAVRRPLSEVLEVPLSNGRSVPSRDGGFPVLRLTALKEDGVDLEERKGGAWERAEAVRFLVKEGDFLIARGNGSLRLVGKGSLLRHEPDEVAFPDTAIRARARPSAVLPEFLSLVWNSRSTRDQIERVARTSAGIYKVNQSQLGAIQLPVPELSEQMSIVAAMSRLQEHRHVALETIDIATRRSHSLRRAVLAAAFEGKLTGRHTDVEVVEELAGA